MKSPDLWLIIQKLEAKEISRFRKFIASPYFNSDPKHIQLFEAVLEQIQEGRCAREALDAILFPNKPFSYTRITNLISDLKKLAENFLVQEELRNQNHFGEFFLMKSMKDRSLDKFFQQSGERLKKQIQENYFETEKDFLMSFLTEEEEYQHALIKESSPKSHIDRKIKSLHLFYVATMLKSVCQDLDYLAGLQQDQTKLPHQFFIRYILNNQKLYHRETLLSLYIQVLLILVEPQRIEAFGALLKQLEESKDKISHEEQWSLFLYAQRHALRQFSLGKYELKKLLFLHYKSILEGNWAIRDNFLSPEAGKQLLYLGVELGEIEATLSFINTYAQYANSPVKKVAQGFYQAYFLYKSQKQPKKALAILLAQSYEQTVFDKDAPALLMQIYYERYDDEALEKLWESFVQYLKTDKSTPAEERNVFLGLRKQVKKLTKLRTQSRIAQPAIFEKSWQKLKKEVEESPMTLLKPWLLEEVEALKKP